MTHITYCERRVYNERCRSLATTYAAGQWVCPAHTPQPDPSCSHSLRDMSRCEECDGVGTIDATEAACEAQGILYEPSIHDGSDDCDACGGTGVIPGRCSYCGGLVVT